MVEGWWWAPMVGYEQVHYLRRGEGGKMRPVCGLDVGLEYGALVEERERGDLERCGGCERSVGAEVQG